MILVFGSLNLDLIATMAVVPEAGATVAGQRLIMRPGGKGANQAVAAARAGARVAMAGAVGADAFAAPLLAALDGAGVERSLVQPVADIPTGSAMIWVDGAGENRIVVITGANASARAAAVPDAALPAGGLVVLQQEVPGGENLALAARARSAGARVCLSLAPALSPPPGLLELVDLLLVNQGEAALAVRGLGLAAETPEGMAGALHAAHGATVVLTLGGAGALAVDGAGLVRVPALPVQAVDTTGAGDAFAGVLAARLAEQAPLEEALVWAAVAGALATQALGAQEAMPDRAAIAAEVPRLRAERA